MDSSQQKIRSAFETIANTPESDVRLDEAVLLIAAETEPSLNIDQSLHQLDLMAQRFEETASGQSQYGISVSGLVNFIHQQEGFSGNVRDYYDPANSYLNKVLDNKIGIPITLAIVHLALGDRLNIPVCGINFPGHFLVKYSQDRKLIIDPFTGRILSEPDCGTLLKQIAGPSAILQPHYFEPASKQDIMLRILDNLKQIFWRNKDWNGSRLCIERQLLLRPKQGEYNIQLGTIYEMQGNLTIAQALYERILQQSSDQQAKELASKRLLALGTTTNRTIH